MSEPSLDLFAFRSVSSSVLELIPSDCFPGFHVTGFQLCLASRRSLKKTGELEERRSSGISCSLCLRRHLLYQLHLLFGSSFFGQAHQDFMFHHGPWALVTPPILCICNLEIVSSVIDNLWVVSLPLFGFLAILSSTSQFLVLTPFCFRY